MTRWARAGLLLVVASVLLVGTLAWCERTGRRFWFSVRRAEAPEVVDVPAAARRRDLARVVLVTLDGPVTADVLSPEKMPRLHQAFARKGVLLDAHVASFASLSLPGYAALATGALTDCEDNDCPRIGQETGLEFLARTLRLPKEQVAVFASWSRLDRAVASNDERVFISEPPEGDSTPERPWRNARLDDETFQLAEAHWHAHHPRFLQLSLLDTDEWAHRGDLPNYERALRAADGHLARVLEWVDALPDDERAMTTVLVTSDHGRGSSDWREHQPFDVGAGAIFFAAFGDGIPRAAEREVVDQRDVRWTIERLFGVCTREHRPPSAGQPIDAVVKGLPCAP